MLIQDKDVKRWIRVANCIELTESIETLQRMKGTEYQTCRS